MVQEADFSKFVTLHEPQLVSSGIPQHFWKNLFIKLKNQIFDSNNTFSLLKIDYEGPSKYPAFIVQTKNEINSEDDRHIYLIDHAWTFRLNTAKKQLFEMDFLLDRMSNLMEINCENFEEKIEKVYREMWKYVQTYSVANAANIENRLPIWYIMDELGCGVIHSDQPNFRAVPLVFLPEQITYTIIFPVKNVEIGETVTRDFAEGISNELERKCLLYPWVHTDFSAINFTQNEPDNSYFLSGHIEESLPEKTDFIVEVPNKLKVFSEYSVINKFLNHPRFELTNDETIADVFWYTSHFKNYFEFSQNPNRFVNQFPFENILTIKDLLAIICRRNSSEHNLVTLETFPKWLPATFNLKTELSKFISYYQNRDKIGLDNHWICKPWNLARSLDTHITNNLDLIIRLASTGSKIAQKYIENPVLFDRPEVGKVKFDVRYVILLKSVSPLKVYIYNNFFLRFSNKPFDLNDFEDYEKHFTVMNYDENTVLHHLKCADFLQQWAQQYPEFPWQEIEKKICKMLKEVFEAATSATPPKGIGVSPQSRAVYATDIMLSWEGPENCIEPKLLEINWTPDCQRACDYYPDFYNNIFDCLFLNNENNDVFTCL